MNTQVKHTPGPWAWISDHTHRQFDIYMLCHNIQASAFSKHICTVNNIPKHHLENRDPQQAEANARLIAAAPAMYEALKAIQAWSFEQPWPCREMKQFTDIDAALAQAEGRG